MNDAHHSESPVRPDFRRLDWRDLLTFLGGPGFILTLLGSGLISDMEKVRVIQFCGIGLAIFCTLLLCTILHQRVVERSNKRLLSGVVWRASGLADKLELLTFHFLEDSTKPKPKLHGVLWTLCELTEFEKGVPEQTEVLIERPSAIETQSSPELNDIMKANGKRSVTYKVLDKSMPDDWAGMSHVTSMEPKHRRTPLSGATASLVLPSYGMVLYKLHCVSGTTNLPADIHHPDVWHQHSYAAMHAGTCWIAGFVLIPIPQSIGASDSYLALHMRHGDIDELIHRIF